MPFAWGTNESSHTETMLVLKFTSHDDLESTRNLLLIAHVLTNARTRTQDEKRELYDDVYAEASRFGSVSGLAIPTAPPHIPPNQVSNTALSSKWNILLGRPCGSQLTLFTLLHCVCLLLRYMQGCSARFLGSGSSIKFVKILDTSNCSSSLICNLENWGFCCFWRSKTLS
jgi:hypothetical protein